MNQQQLWFVMEKAFHGCTFQSILFNETGQMLVKYFDSGGNYHEEILANNGRLITVAV